MDEWVIFWVNPSNGDKDYEVFESEQDARRSLADYAAKFPWNAYMLSQVRERVSAITPYRPT